MISNNFTSVRDPLCRTCEEVNNAKAPNCCNLDYNQSFSWGLQPQNQLFYLEPEPPQPNPQLLVLQVWRVKTNRGVKWLQSGCLWLSAAHSALLFCILKRPWNHLTAGPIMAPPPCAFAEKRSGNQLRLCLQGSAGTFSPSLSPHWPFCSQSKYQESEKGS